MALEDVANFFSLRKQVSMITDDAMLIMEWDYISPAGAHETLRDLERQWREKRLKFEVVGNGLKRRSWRGE
jgi:hypothetical protein